MIALDFDNALDDGVSGLLRMKSQRSLDTLGAKGGHKKYDLDISADRALSQPQAGSDLCLGC